MSTIRYTTEFAASPEAVFPFLEDSDKVKQWMIGVLEDRPTSEPPTRVGSTFEMDIKEGGKVVTYQGEVTKYEKNQLMAVRLVGGCGKTPMTMHAEYALSRKPGGGTRLDYTCTAEMPTGFLFKLMAPLFRIFGRVMVKKFMKNLRGLVDGNAMAAGAS
ncbi:MAG: SRPBCC family protein [Planctomycetes bacterium]|nr:SRPBCC family protein [Planctomycetota bacterium]